MNYQFSGLCPVCGGADFMFTPVLWQDLIDAWQLAPHEIEYINRQQGYYCAKCSNNMRTMGLSAAILMLNGFEGTLIQLCESSCSLEILQINTVCNLTPILIKLKNHKLIEYPLYDMMNLDVESDKFDLVIHSDTLEHIPLPERGISECLRVLRHNGKCIFTVPIVVDRTTRTRVGLPASYHGKAEDSAEDQLVISEFGTDIWKTVLKGGFSSCEIFSFEYPSALVIIATK